jgi:flagellar hook protein FlgE
MIASATKRISFSGNLDATADDDDECKYETHVYDSLGNSHALTFTFTKTNVNNIWGYEIGLTGENSDNGSLGSGTIEFTPGGRYKDEEGINVIEPFTLELETETGAENLTITPDFSAFTQLAFPSSVSLREQDGFPRGGSVHF